MTSSIVIRIIGRFGERVRDLRKKRGLTLEELASLANMSYVYLNEIERAKRNPSLKVINRIAKALKVSLWELFMGMETKRTRPTIEEIRFKDLCKMDKPRKGKIPGWRKKYPL